MFIFKKRVGYFLFFHLRNCQMETECSHITHNGLGLCAVWDFKAQKFSLAQMLIEVQMFNLVH